MAKAASARRARPGAKAAGAAFGPEGRQGDAAGEEEPAPEDLTEVVGANLRRLRQQRDLSLERLSKLSGVSRAMLGQIELGQSAPTINVLWKIARALGVPFSTLIRHRSSGGTRVSRAKGARVLTSAAGAFRSRALFPGESPRPVEFYELRLAPQASEEAEPHAPGTTEKLVVASGRLEVRIGGETHLLEPGDAISFEADVPHAYVNPGSDEARMFLVMTYADRVE